MMYRIATFVLLAATATFIQPSVANAGHVDGMNLYRAYFAPSKMDSTGNCTQECCCVDDIAIDPTIDEGGRKARFIAPIVTDDGGFGTREGTAWGHKFTIVSTLTRSTGKQEGKCRIEWWELSSDPYGEMYKELGAVDGEWFGAHRPIYEGRAVTQDWKDYQDGKKAFDENGSLVLKQEDTPRVPFNHSRVARFSIRIFSTPDCDCTMKVKKIEFHQILERKGGPYIEDAAFPPRNVDELPKDHWKTWELKEGLGDPDKLPPE